MKKRSALSVLSRMIGLVKPLAGAMFLAVILGIGGFICAEFITIMGGYAMLDVLKFESAFSLKTVCVCVIVFAVLRAACRCSEQYLNHYIAFNVLAIIRGRVFGALRRLCPAKLEGRDKGDTLSGGERQRIGLARAFLHDAPLMLLDEPTSNLDSLNEAVILKSLLDKGEEKTVLLVSHRPSTMRICDVSYSVENGRMS